MSEKIMKSLRLLVGAQVLILTVAAAYGHVTIQPKESTVGASETYTMRVPTEKFTPTVRVEVEFPANLNVSQFEPKPEWKIEEKKNASGKIVGAVLTGSIPTGKSEMFHFTAKNPVDAGTMSVKVIQIYEDGTKSEWTGGAGSRTPAPSIELKK